jgi:hypothetical protein
MDILMEGQIVVVARPESRDAIFAAEKQELEFSKELY